MEPYRHINLPAKLPDIATAQLPALYENAKKVIAECARIDECKDWADKAAALASYARQSEDDELRAFADRIRARAIRRCGELLAEIPKAKGGITREGTPGSQPSPVSRSTMASEAGMSERQQKTALRVAAVERETFEAGLALPKPKTVTELAALGTKHAPRPLVDLGGRAPEDFIAATQGMGHVRELADFAERIRPETVVRGTLEHEREPLARRATIAIAWLNDLIAELEETNERA